MSKKEKTLELLNRIDKKLEQLSQRFQNLDSEKLTFTPSQNQWNALQVIEHLRFSESSSLNYLEYKKSKADTSYKNTGPVEAFKMMLFKRRYRNPKPLKAPKVKGLVPDAKGLDKETILNTWEKDRVALRKFLEATPADAFQKNMYKHPVLGRINLHHMLEFFDYHMDRHQIQLDRLLNHS